MAAFILEIFPNKLPNSQDHELTNDGDGLTRVLDENGQKLIIVADDHGFTVTCPERYEGKYSAVGCSLPLHVVSPDSRRELWAVPLRRNASLSARTEYHIQRAVMSGDPEQTKLTTIRRLTGED